MYFQCLQAEQTILLGEPYIKYFYLHNAWLSVRTLSLEVDYFLAFTYDQACFAALDNGLLIALLSPRTLPVQGPFHR